MLGASRRAASAFFAPVARRVRDTALGGGELDAPHALHRARAPPRGGIRRRVRPARARHVAERQYASSIRLVRLGGCRDRARRGGRVPVRTGARRLAGPAQELLREPHDPRASPRTPPPLRPRRGPWVGASRTGSAEARCWRRAAFKSEFREKCWHTSLQVGTPHDTYRKQKTHSTSLRPRAAPALFYARQPSSPSPSATYDRTTSSQHASSARSFSATSDACATTPSTYAERLVPSAERLASPRRRTPPPGTRRRGAPGTPSRPPAPRTSPRARARLRGHGDVVYELERRERAYGVRPEKHARRRFSERFAERAARRGDAQALEPGGVFFFSEKWGRLRLRLRAPAGARDGVHERERAHPLVLELQRGRARRRAARPSQHLHQIIKRRRVGERRLRFPERVLAAPFRNTPSANTTRRASDAPGWSRSVASVSTRPRTVSDRVAASNATPSGVSNRRESPARGTPRVASAFPRVAPGTFFSFKNRRCFFLVRPSAGQRARPPRRRRRRTDSFRGNARGSRAARFRGRTRAW